ncbi:biotin transporter BioY [Virgibacillus halophilus]|uniref:Biotin transporter BioY n=1 Tax=Tigheibacillus halophilus TaxID=361280 RepID=A0ABU5C1J6_9BACI|nr:biotin transporter BioY [Virgibacillus halophilus]
MRISLHGFQCSLFLLAVPLYHFHCRPFFAIAAGLMLGKKLGSIAMIAYVLIGTAGVPVFAGFSAGPMALISPTGGFIFSFIAIAFFSGWISRIKQVPMVSTYIAGAVAGLLFNYGIGVTYMYIGMNTWLHLPISYQLAWTGMIPFLIKDGGLAILAALFVLQLSKRLNPAVPPGRSQH